MKTNNTLISKLYYPDSAFYYIIISQRYLLIDSSTNCLLSVNGLLNKELVKKLHICRK